MKQRITNVPRQFVEHFDLLDLFCVGRGRSKMHLLQRVPRPLAALPLPLLLLLALTALANAAIDKDNKSSSLSPSPSLNGAELQHNVINLSLHTEIKGSHNASTDSGSGSDNDSDSFVQFDLTRTQRLRDSLNVFDLSLLAAQWPRLEAERVLSVNCTKDMRSYLRGLSEAAMWAVKSEYTRARSGNAVGMEQNCRGNTVRKNRKPCGESNLTAKVAEITRIGL